MPRCEGHDPIEDPARSFGSCIGPTHGTCAVRVGSHFAPRDRGQGCETLRPHRFSQAVRKRIDNQSPPTSSGLAATLSPLARSLVGSLMEVGSTWNFDEL